MNVDVMRLDLTSLESTKNFIENFKQKNFPLHILICNAGIFMVPFGKNLWQLFRKHFNLPLKSYHIAQNFGKRKLKVWQHYRVAAFMKMAHIAITSILHVIATCMYHLCITYASIHKLYNLF